VFVKATPSSSVIRLLAACFPIALVFAAEATARRVYWATITLLIVTVLLLVVDGFKAFGEQGGGKQTNTYQSVSQSADEWALTE
jgi:hypothetical protein